MTTHLSTLALHQLRYGELDAAARALATSHLDGCERCRRRLHVQTADRDAFVLQPVPAAIRQAAAPSVAERLAAWLRPMVPLAAMVAAVATFVAVPVAREAGAPLTAERTRTKGSGAPLEIWVAREGGPRALRDAEVLREGDTIQVLFDPRGARHVAVVGRDPTGAVEIWGTLAVERAGLQAAPFALTLDGARGYQEVLVVRSAWPLSAEGVRAAIDGSRPPNVLGVESVLLPKE